MLVAKIVQNFAFGIKKIAFDSFFLQKKAGR